MSTSTLRRMFTILFDKPANAGRLGNFQINYEKDESTIYDRDSVLIKMKMTREIRKERDSDSKW